MRPFVLDVCGDLGTCSVPFSPRPKIRGETSMEIPARKVFNLLVLEWREVLQDGRRNRSDFIPLRLDGIQNVSASPSRVHVRHAPGKQLSYGQVNRESTVAAEE